jgi:hypothetical protein
MINAGTASGSGTVTMSPTAFAAIADAARSGSITSRHHREGLPNQHASLRGSTIGRAAGALVATVVLLCASACSGSGVHTQSDPVPTPSMSSSAPTPTPTGQVSSAKDRAGAAAIAQVVRYERLLDTLAIHPRASLDRLYTVSTQPAVAEEIAYLNRFREARDRQTGRVQLSAIRVDQVNMTDHPHAHRPVYPTVTVTSCVKVSGVKAVNSKGHSIVALSRKPYFLTHFTLVNFKYPEPKQWLVRKVTDTEERSCGA